MEISSAWTKRIVTFFGAGLSPKAPGTVGTLATIPLAILLLWAGPFVHMGFVIALTLFGFWICERYEKQKGGHDHPEVVIDEVAGYLIAVVWLPLTWQTLLAGFVLFRFFDVLKPWPIRVLDEKVPGGVGVMIDDVAAGLVSSIILQYVYVHTSWLGGQIT